MYSSRLFPRLSLTTLFIPENLGTPSEPPRHATNQPDASGSLDAPPGPEPEPFVINPVPALASLLAELTSESERYLLACAS
jgi:hypothetical protein